jgi:transposase
MGVAQSCCARSGRVARWKHGLPIVRRQHSWDRTGGFSRFLTDGRICQSNNAAERVLRGIALGRKSWLFCGSDRGGQRAAAMYSLIVTAKLNDVDPRAWLADTLARIAETPQSLLSELLPWSWMTDRLPRAAA